MIVPLRSRGRPVRDAVVAFACGAFVAAMESESMSFNDIQDTLNGRGVIFTSELIKKDNAVL